MGMIRVLKSLLVDCAARSTLDPPPGIDHSEGSSDYPIVVEGTIFGDLLSGLFFKNLPTGLGLR